jgi:hypothetical protein
LPMPICSSVFPTLSHTSFKVAGLILRSFIHFKLILVWDQRHGSNFSLLHADIQFSQQHLLKSVSSLHRMFLTFFVKNQVGQAVWIYVRVFYSVPLVFRSGFCASTMLFLLLWYIV